MVERSRQAGSDAETLYLTLCGAAAHEIEMLIEKGIIRLTETGAVDKKDAERVIALDSSPNVTLSLVEKYPGLRVINKSLKDLLGSPSPLNWPGKVERIPCRAQLVNLDFNGGLKGTERSGQIVFEDFEIISKIAILHAEQVPSNWRLFVTYNCDLDWDQKTVASVLAFLQENFAFSSQFEDECKAFLGDDLMRIIHCQDTEGVKNLDPIQGQRLLMVFVPKKIAAVVVDGGWLVKTIRNLRYGAYNAHAPMVTWAFDFEWDTRASSIPKTVYREALSAILTNHGNVEPDGTCVTR